MIDCHLHLLPDLDDGPSTLEESLLLAQALVDDGVRTAVATPHVGHPALGVDPAVIPGAVEAFVRSLAERRIPLEVLAGGEIHVLPATPERLLAGDLPRLGGGRYYLIEFPQTGIPPFLDAFLVRLKAAGFAAVIAHPERFPDVQEDPASLGPLRRRGALVQVTAEAVLGLSPNERESEAAEALLDLGCVDIIATDSHGTSQRPPSLGRAVEVASHFVGPHRAIAMVESTPAEVLGRT